MIRLWRTWPNIFFTNLMREGTCWETDDSTDPMRWLNLPSGYQEIKLWRRGEWAEYNAVCIILGKKCESDTTGLAQTGRWKMTLIYVTSLWLTTGMSRWNLSKNCVTMWPTCADWTPWNWHGRVSLWQTHPGRKWRELSLRLACNSHLATKAVRACWSYLYLFYNLYQIIHLCLHLYHSFKYSNLVLLPSKNSQIFGN